MNVVSIVMVWQLASLRLFIGTRIWHHAICIATIVECLHRVLNSLFAGNKSHHHHCILRANQVTVVLMKSCNQRVFMEQVSPRNTMHNLSVSVVVLHLMCVTLLWYIGATTKALDQR